MATDFGEEKESSTDEARVCSGWVEQSSPHGEALQRRVTSLEEFEAYVMSYFDEETFAGLKIVHEALKRSRGLTEEAVLKTGAREYALGW